MQRILRCPFDSISLLIGTSSRRASKTDAAPFALVYTLVRSFLALAVLAGNSGRWGFCLRNIREYILHDATCANLLTEVESAGRILAMSLKVQKGRNST